jgi:hypothetical protein
MTWLVWRQHRGEVLVSALVLAALGLLLLLHGLPMHEAYQQAGVESCQQRLGTDEACVEVVVGFENQYGYLPEQFVAWVPLLPMLAGMLIGAPLLAREYEQGTWQLVWTQGVTRARWLTAKLALVLGTVLAVSVAFAAGVSWWVGPLSADQFTHGKFNHAVLVFPAYVLGAVAIGVLAGAVVKRTIVAAAITVGGYLLVRIPVEFLLRPRFREPVTTDDLAEANAGWIVGDQIGGGSGDLIQYHPSDRFWQFQLIETAILLGITVVILAVAWRLVLGRKSPASGSHREPAPISA